MNGVAQVIKGKPVSGYQYYYPFYPDNRGEKGDRYPLTETTSAAYNRLV
jgi:hypothetical protein